LFKAKAIKIIVLLITTISMVKKIIETKELPGKIKSLPVQKLN